MRAADPAIKGPFLHVQKQNVTNRDTRKKEKKSGNVSKIV